MDINSPGQDAATTPPLVVGEGPAMGTSFRPELNQVVLFIELINN